MDELGDVGADAPIARVAVPEGSPEASLVAEALSRGGLAADFVRDGESFSLEFKDAGRHLHVMPLTHLDARFGRLLADLADKHVGLEVTGVLEAGTLAVRDVSALRRIPQGESLRPMSPNLLATMVRRLRTARPQPRREARPQPAPLSFSRPEEVAEFLSCMEDTLPANVRDWAYQNLALARDGGAGKDEKRHAMRALSLMMGVQWQDAYFEHIDPREARRVLDEELYGLDAVKQRVVETVIQINRTHTLPFYGLLLVGPPGTGKSRIAYAVARILRLPWAVLDLSSIHDPSALTGSPRVYSNAMPGRIMEAFVRAGSSNLVFVVNELDKANDASATGSAADALLTLFDNLGFTDNYVECQIPTGGVYPIATANDLSRVSGPLLSRFSVIRIDDYSPEEKRVIFTDYALPKVLGHLGMRAGELELTEGAVDRVVSRFEGTPGCRELEQAAEHLAAHALYELEVTGAPSVRLDEDDVRRLLAT